MGSVIFLIQLSSSLTLTLLVSNSSVQILPKSVGSVLCLNSNGTFKKRKESVKNVVESTARLSNSITLRLHCLFMCLLMKREESPDLWRRLCSSAMFSSLSCSFLRKKGTYFIHQFLEQMKEKEEDDED